MSYLEAGDPSGPAVLMLHGYTDTRLSFQGTIEHLVRLRPDLRLIAPDLRGHGRTSMPSMHAYRHAPERAFAMSDFAADLFGLLDAKGIRRASVVGHSLGSFIAQEMALMHPSRIAQIVLIGSSAKVSGNTVIAQGVLGQIVEGTWGKALEARGMTFPDDAYLLTPLDVDPHVEPWLVQNWLNEPLARPELLAQIAADCARIPLGTWVGVARAALQMDNRERLKALKTPALVLWAIQDGICPERPDQETLIAALAAASERTGVHYAFECFGERPLPPPGVTEDDLGHNFHWAIPEQVARSVARFLERRRAPVTSWSARSP
jgi:pimeloyl-ACP methyl ester carboxylesterase